MVVYVGGGLRGEVCVCADVRGRGDVMVMVE